jgi:DHA1 family inner membrane transport protein
LIFVVTNLPRVPLAVAVGVVGTFMLSNAGRMVAALTMITGSVERRLRGGFMSANSAVQHLASGLGAFIGGQTVSRTADGAMVHFNRVGLFAAVVTALSLWLAGRVRPAPETSPSVGGAAEPPTEISESTLDLAADAVATEPF